MKKLIARLLHNWLHYVRRRILERDDETRQRNIVTLISAFIEQKWDMARPELIPGLEMRKWNAGQLVISHSRLTRGDLIDLFYHDMSPARILSGESGPSQVGCWVDQSHAYRRWLGIYDVQIMKGITPEFVARQLAEFGKPTAVSPSQAASHTH